MSTRRVLTIALLILSAYILQTAVIASLPWPLVGPDLMLLIFLSWTIHLPRLDAVVLGFATGLFIDLAPPAEGPIGKWALLLAGAAVVITRLRTNADAPVVRVALVSLFSAGLVAAGYAFTSILGEDHLAPGALLTTVVGIAMWNVVFAPSALMLVRRLMRSTTAVEVIR
jgi:rod shape-determining protein MreD